MNASEDSEPERYEAVQLRAEQQSQSMRTMMANITSAFVMQHASEIIHATQQLTALSIQSSAYLNELSMKYGHNSEKFRMLIRGAERRLDRQLDDLSALRRALIAIPTSTGDPQSIARQQQLQNAISEAQESFNNEIDRLYDL